MIDLNSCLRLLRATLLGATAVAVFPLAAQPFAYAVNPFANNVAFINTANNNVFGALPLPAGPQNVVVNAAGTRLYVTNTGDTSLTVVDTVTATHVTTLSIGYVWGIALHPASPRAYVANRDANSVAVMDTSSNSIIAGIPVGNQPLGVAINPAGTRLYVANNGGGSVSVIDTGTNTVIATVPVGIAPFAIAVNPAGTRAYVANRGSNNVSIIDLANNTVVGMPVAVGPSPAGVAVNSAGTRVYVANSAGSGLSVIETTGNTVLTTVALPFDPFHQMAFNTAGTKLYVPLSNAGNAIAVVDTATDMVSTTISVASPFGVAVNPTSNPMVPAAPTIGTATGGNAQASVTFTPPAFNGGSAITGYTVTANPGGNSATGAASPLVVTGLTNGQTYTFTVQANNALGSGFPSADSNAVTLAVPPVTAIVTNTNDAGVGSLRQAILDTNNGGICPSTSTINFNIPGPGPHVISPASDLPTIDCPTLIDGYSQPGATPNTLPNGVSGSNAVIKIRIDGAGAMLSGNGLTLIAGSAGAIVRGLSIGGFASGPGIHVGSGADSVSVLGNFIGVAPDGTAAGNGNGVEVFSEAVQIGASAPAARNIVACNSGDGIEISGSADVYNNEIGTRPDGSTACGNSGGVNFKSASGGSVGGPGAGNFIRNNLGDGIFLDSTDFILVSNNIINSNSNNGITFGTRSDCAGAGNTFRGNSIGTNGALGILLQAFGSRGVNDPLDTDGGGCGSDGNRGQNYPVIDLVTYRPDKTLVDFTLSSEASKTYDIEVFSNITADTPNHGRGETSRATTTVSTDAMGSVSVTNFVVSNTAPDGLNISMLATEQSQGDTSEFSNAYITPASFAPLAGFSAFSITAGGNQSQVITFTNTLGQLASFAAPSILPAGNFTVTANTCGAMVAFPGTCQITVQYARAMAGTDSAVLEVVLPAMANPTAGANTKYQFPLAGTALAGAAAINVTGTTTFPSVSMGATSAIQTITITNTGGANLSISAISNSNSAAFFDTTGGAAPQAAHYCGFGSNAAGVPLAGGPIVIAPLATCQLNIAFKAVATGANTANIVISSNDPMFPTKTVTLTGTGLAAPPAVTLGVAPATVAVGGTALLTITLTTPSAPNDPLIMGAVATLPAGLAVAAMPLPTTTCGTTVTASGQNISFSGGAIPPMPGCTITVPVTPSVAGSYSVNFAAGALTTSKGTNAAAATSALTATNSPTMTAAFAPATVLTNTNSTLTLTLSNPNPAPAFMPLGGVVTMPIGLVIASLVDNCGASASIIVSTVTTIDLGMSGTIPAMGSCTITVQAQSNIVGAYTVTVSPGNLVTALGNNTNTSAATLTVTAPAPTVVLSNASLGFGSRTVNTTSPAQTVTLTNGGTANLVITSITSSGDFGYTTTCPISTPPVAPASPACNINVTFTPLTVGALTGSVSIVSNAPGSPHTILLTGTGAPVAVPGITVSPTTLNLGSSVVGTFAPQQSITVSNPGTATLNLASIAVTGAAFVRVVPISTNPTDCGASLAPTSSCQIAVACNPPTVGVQTGQVSITHNAAGSPTAITLACTGNPLPVPVIALTPTVDFGDQILNTASSVRTINISNSGTAPLNISSVTLTGANANQFAIAGQCAIVAAGASCPLSVSFTPTSTGIKTASISVTSNAQNAATVNTVALSGNGVLAPRSIVSLSLTAIGYGNSIFGGASTNQVLLLRNEGGLPLTINSITAGGDYMVSHNCGGTVASLATCTINVAFVPIGVGNRVGELIIVSNASGSPHRVQLSGTGCRWFSQSGSRLFLTSCGN